MAQPSIIVDRISSVLGWFFGLLVVLMAIGAFPNSFLAVILFLFAACIFIPPTGKLIDSKISLSFYQKSGLIAALTMIAMFLAAEGRNHEREIQMAQQEKLQNQLEEKKSIAYFNENSEKILADLRKYVKNQKYNEAVALSSKYLKVDNKELSALHDKANNELISIRNKQIAKEKAEKLKQEQALIVASQPKAQIANCSGLHLKPLRTAFNAI
jgi:hypothetical protein